jgi:predicted permease
MNELRFALRRLAARPAACTASIAALAMGIAAAAVAWSLISAAILHPLPVRDPDRLVVVGQRMDIGPMAGMTFDGILYPRFAVIRDADVFEEVTAQWDSPVTVVVEAGGQTTKVSAGFVAPGFFSVLGVQVPLGRQFAGADDVRGGALAAIVTDRFWRRTLDGDAAAVGRTIRIAGKPATIVGVLPHGFRGLHLGDEPDLYVPLQTIADIGSPYTNYLADPRHQSSPTAGLAVIGRLHPGESRDEALARIRSLSSFTAHEVKRLGLTPIDTAALPPAARGSLPQFTILLASTVGLLLLIGCAAVGTLLLVRTEARAEEFAMCLALGASRSRLARGVGLEGLLLAGAGAVLALPAAAWLMDGIRSFQLPGHIDVSRLDLAVDATVVLVCAVAAVVATLVVTLIASAFGFTANLGDALRSRSATRPARRWPRTVLVAGQTAFALVLVVGAGLFARSLAAALRLNPNVDAAHVLTTFVMLDVYGRPGARDRAFFDELRQRLARDPSIASVAFGVSRGSMLGRLTVDGATRQYPSSVTFDGVDEGYFRTLGLPLLEGRDFKAADQPGAPMVAIVSRSFARLIAPGRSALGHRLTMPWREADRPANVVEIVGVVPDVVDKVTATEPLAVYLPMTQLDPGGSRDITVRAAGDVEAARRAILSAVKSIDASVVPPPPMTIEEGIARQMNAQRFAVVVLGAFAALALLLTALGTYVLAESMTSSRLREMGIRSAMGATGGQLAGLVLSETGRLAGIGVVCGVGLAWVASGAIRALLFRVQPLDPTTLGAAAALIFGVAAVVTIRPALRAARVDVALLLRRE